MIIAIDFDGTIVKHQYPFIGEEVPHALESINKLDQDGHILFLWTVRVGNELQQAIRWLKNKAPTIIVPETRPGQKVFASVYIDDMNLGCPVIRPRDGRRAFVDWRTTMDMLVDFEVVGNSDHHWMGPKISKNAPGV